MRKELDNNYFNGLAGGQKFLGKSKLNVHGGNNNTVSNVLSTIDGGVTLEWNYNGVMNDGTSSSTEQRLVPAGTPVITCFDIIKNRNIYTFASVCVDKETGEMLFAGYYDGDEYRTSPNFVGILENDIDFKDSNSIFNVGVATTATVNAFAYVKNIPFNNLDVADEFARLVYISGGEQYWKGDLNLSFTSFVNTEK